MPKFRWNLLTSSSGQRSKTRWGVRYRVRYRCTEGCSGLGWAVAPFLSRSSQARPSFLSWYCMRGFLYIPLSLYGVTSLKTVGCKLLWCVIRVSWKASLFIFICILIYSAFQRSTKVDVELVIIITIFTVQNGGTRYKPEGCGFDFR
jgi:hypothetical protein